MLFGEGLEPTIRLHAAPERPVEWIAHVAAPLHGTGNGRRDWDAAGVAADYADELARLVASRLAISASELAVQDVCTPADRERLTGTPGGSVHGPAIDSVSTAILRSPTIQPIKGLLHIGASARPGPGLAFAALSAWNAAEVLRPTRV